ncbi:cytochrome c-552 [Striga asiatica]|uniref:Cytochrome c-552 n=1 Tax=Striga asiatica TaxID=4170 RepID=A0A5A7PM57_STRAF|nr:cytochrome c-552 [Striga asiatica]
MRNDVQSLKPEFPANDKQVVPFTTSIKTLRAAKSIVAPPPNTNPTAGTTLPISSEPPTKQASSIEKLPADLNLFNITLTSSSLSAALEIVVPESIIVGTPKSEAGRPSSLPATVTPESFTKYSVGSLSSDTNGVNLKPPLPILPSGVAVGRQYANPDPYFPESCDSKESSFFASPISPDERPKSPSLSCPHPNTNPASDESGPNVSRSRLRNPIENDWSP